MPDIIKVNSRKGMVTFSQQEMVDYDIFRYMSHNSKGIHNRVFIDAKPFETVAAKLFVDKYPSMQIKIAEAVHKNNDETVTVVLRIAEDRSSGYYETHPTKLVFTKGKEKEVEKLASVDEGLNFDEFLKCGEEEIPVEDEQDYNPKEDMEQQMTQGKGVNQGITFQGKQSSEDQDEKEYNVYLEDAEMTRLSQIFEDEGMDSSELPIVKSKMASEEIIDISLKDMELLDKIASMNFQKTSISKLYDVRDFLTDIILKSSDTEITDCVEYLVSDIDTAIETKED